MSDAFLDLVEAICRLAYRAGVLWLLLKIAYSIEAL